MRPPLGETYRWGSGLTKHVIPIRFICGFCGHATSDDRAYYPLHKGGDNTAVAARISIRICGSCERPTFVERGEPNVPAARLGETVLHLPADVNRLYEEMRDASAVGAYTSCVLTARKVLMHVAVNKGAAEGLTFVQYVEYLSEEHHIPAGGNEWVGHIRKRGNEANHEIEVMEEADATGLITLTTQLLRNVYELPKSVPGSRSEQSEETRKPAEGSA